MVSKVGNGGWGGFQEPEINIYTLLYITDKIYRYPTRDKHIHTTVYN